MLRDRFQSGLRHLSIGQKISFGYIAALGVAVLGTSSGIALGEYYHYEAKEHREDVEQEVRILQALQSELAFTQIHERVLAAQLQELQRHSGQQTILLSAFRSEYAKLRSHAKDGVETWSNLKASYREATVIETEEELAVFQDMLKRHDDIPHRYIELVNELAPTVERATRQPGDLAALQLVLKELDQHSLSGDFRQFMQQSESLFDTVLAEEQEVEESIENVERLKTQIIIGSLICSVAIAMLLAALTRWLIVRPIKAATQVAQQVTQDDNFDLQVPILSQDEIGIMATALNAMIQRVKHLMVQQKLAEAQLVHNEKMSSLGQLLAGVAHEINNPVNFIHGNLVYARQHAEDLLRLIRLYQQEYPKATPSIQAEIDAIELDFLQKDLSKLLDSMEIGSHRIRKIVKSLHSFSRFAEADIKSTDIHDGLNSTLMILQHRLKGRAGQPHIQIVKNYDALPPVQCYPDQLNQVFMNLITNAIDVLEDHNQRRSPDDLKVDPGVIQICTQACSNNWVKIRIIDNGPGIPEKIRSKLFDPFFTTKPVGKGTGLGLSISHQIVVEKHQGKLYCHSRPGQGTEFVIEIPTASSSNNGHAKKT
ncbi:MAG TPA: ATP-binding protein [Crinalium sp.]